MTLTRIHGVVTRNNTICTFDIIKWNGTIWCGIFVNCNWVDTRWR